MNKFMTGEENLPVYQGNIPDSFEISFTPQKDWAKGELLAFYLGGVGAGLYVISQFLGFGAGLVVGFLLVAVCKNAAHMKTATHPKLAFRAIFRPQTSWISRGALFVGVFVFFGALDITQRLGWIQWSSFWAVVFSILSFSSAVLVMIYLGFLMASARAIPLWRSPMTPAVFLSYSLTLGAAGAAILNPAMDAPAKAQLAPILLFMAAITFSLIFIQLTVLKYAGQAAVQTLNLLTRERLKKIFLGGVLVLGLLLPVFLAGYAVMAGSNSGFILFVIGVLMLGGGFLYEKVILNAGIYSPLLEITQ